MPQDSRLTEAQLRLLERLSEGRAVLADESHLATSVYALRARRYVTTSSPRAYSTAAITEYGLEYLRQQKPSPDALNASNLLDRLRAERRILLDAPTDAQRSELRGQIKQTLDSGAIPNGMKLRHTGRSSGPMTIWLEASDRPPPPPGIVITTPDRRIRPHPLIAALRSARTDGNGWLDTRETQGCVHVRVAPASRKRTIDVLHAFVTACAARGHDVREHCHFYRPRSKGGLSITAWGHSFEISIVEETMPVPHVPTKTELANAKRFGSRIPLTHPGQSGRLRLETGHGGYQKTLATDRTRWTLEQHLGQALAKLEALADDAVKRTRLEQIEAASQEAARHERLRAATVRYTEAKNQHALRSLVNDHLTANQIRDFIALARNNTSVTATDEWLAWAATYADRLDPITKGFATPTIQKPSPTDLQPFL